MTHGQCQNDGTCVPDELSPDKTPADEKRTEALWDKSRVKDGANAVRLLVHTHIHTHSNSGINLLTHTHITHQPALWHLQKSFFFFCLRPVIPTFKSYNILTEVSRTRIKEQLLFIALLSEWYLLIKQHLPPRASSGKHTLVPFKSPSLLIIAHANHRSGLTKYFVKERERKRRVWERIREFRSASVHARVCGTSFFFSELQQIWN